GYELDRATDPNFTQNFVAQTLSGTATHFTDTAADLAPGTTYYYRLSAINSYGTSDFTSAASVLIPLPPASPTNAQIKSVTDTSIDLTWTDNAGALATGYTILRSVNGGAFSVAATLPPALVAAPSTYEWQDTHLSPATQYEYHIIAFNASGSSN